MKRIGIFICLYIFLQTQGITQLEWAYNVGGSNQDLGNAITVDHLNNIYVAGNFRETVDFDFGPGVATKTSNGGHDIFIGKYTSAGNLIWVISVGGTEPDDVNDIAVDSNGDVYITGRFQGTVDFDPGPGTAMRTSQGGWDIFVAKYSSTGNHLWSFTMGSVTLAENGTGIDVDQFGNVYVTGCFYNTVDFNPGPGINNLTAVGSADIFLAKYTTNGDYVWAHSFGSNNFESGQRVSVDNLGYVYFAGDIQGPIDFDPGPGTAVLFGNTFLPDGFLAKFTDNGEYVWAFHLTNGNQNRCHALIADPISNSVYLGGFFSGTVDFDPLGSSSFYTSSSGSNGFIAKYNASNGHLIWNNALYGGNTSIRDFSLSNSGNSVWSIGWFTGTVDFDAGVGVENRTSNGSSDIFIARYNSNGMYECAYSFGDNDLDEGRGIVIDSQGNIYATGCFGRGTGIVDFDPGNGTHLLTSNGNLDVFVAKFNSFCPFNELTPVADFTAVGSTTICAGDCINFTDLSTNFPETWSWTFQGATQNTSNVQNPTGICYPNPGTFFVELTVSNQNGSDTKTITSYITVNPIPTVSPTSNSPICEGETLTLFANTVSGATYSWSGPVSFTSNSQNPTIANAQQSQGGTYTVTITSNNCSASGSITVSVQSSSDANITTTQLQYCINDSPVQFTAAQSGGIWSGNGISATGMFNPAVAGVGTHQIIHTITGTCGSADTVLISVQNVSDATITTTQLTYCSNDAPVQFTAMEAGGIWTGNGISSNGMFTPSAPSAGGNIIYTIPGVCGNADTVVVTVFTAPSVNLGTTTTICTGDTLILNAGSGFISYIWSNSANTQSIQITQAGTYSVTVSDSNGCSGSAQITITVSNNADATILSSGPFCANDAPIQLNAVDANGTWSGNGVSSSGLFTPSIAGAGTHTITYTIPDPCGDSYSKDFIVYSAPQFTVAHTNETCSPANDGSVTIVPSQPHYTILWNNGNSDFIRTDLAPGTYTYTVSDTTLCKVTGSISILQGIDDCFPPHVYIPNIFSPNGDGENDILYVRGIGIETMVFLIYNRWGNKVFESNSTEKGWDGSYKNSPCNPGVYAYYLKAQLKNNRTFEKSGTITLVR